MSALLAACEGTGTEERVLGIALPLAAAIVYFLLIGAAFRATDRDARWSLGVVAVVCAGIGAALTVTSHEDEVAARAVIGLVLVVAVALFASREHGTLWPFVTVGVLAGATVLIWGFGLLVLVLAATDFCLS